MRDRADEIGNPLLHLTCGLVGERDREQAERRDALLGDEERDPMREHTGLATPGSRDDEDRTVGRRSCFALDGVEPGEEHGGVGHHCIVPATVRVFG